MAPTRAEAEKIRDASFFSKLDIMQMTGSPDDLAALIQSYADLGINYFILRFTDYPRTDGAKLFIDEVLPRFQ
jgi:alkanesulfonate monooxygenase SsuD/methylene tetrahydromethanopterin reductase-like flavin-dependent oxidoreductase (luciferase family)